jgi:hypothetical protein
MTKLNLLLKIFLFISITGFSSCRSQKEEEGKGLLANIILNGTTNTEYSSLVSVVELERIDPTSFKGKCIDTFLGITTYQFYVNNTYFASGKYDTENRRTATTTKKCIDLGFRDPGGYVINSTGGVSFTSYECSSKNTACNVSTINPYFGTSNSNPKGSFGSFVF